MNFSIPEQNFEGLEKKLARIRNKCAKYGCEFKFERLGEHFEERMVADKISFFGEEVDAPSGHKEIVRFIDVDVEGVAAVNGWQYAASLEYTDKGNIIKGVPGIEIPERFYNCAPWCEHCKTARDRKYSFVVFNEESGEFKQVGKACLRDFTGGLSAEAVAYFESFFKEIEEASEFSGLGGWSKRYYDVKEYLVYCAEMIRVFGFVKNGGLITSTSDRASEAYAIDHNWKMYKSAYERYEEAKSKGFNPKCSKSVEHAEKVAKWISESDTNSNYFHNLKVACSLDMVGGDKLGILASAFPAFDRDLEIQAEKAEREAAAKAEAERSEYVGEVGKRISFVPKDAMCVTSWKTMYGLTCIYKFVDESNNVFVWKTTADVDLDERHPIVKVTGTVKEHKEYRGVKQTELTRCKVQNAGMKAS